MIEMVWKAATAALGVAFSGLFVWLIKVYRDIALHARDIMRLEARMKENEDHVRQCRDENAATSLCLERVAAEVKHCRNDVAEIKQDVKDGFRDIRDDIRGCAHYKPGNNHTPKG